MNEHILLGLRLAAVLITAGIGLSLIYLHAPMRHDMDPYDRMGRYGIAATYLALSVTTLLLVLDVGPEWRSPTVLATYVVTAIGVGRDVGRARRR